MHQVKTQAANPSDIKSGTGKKIPFVWARRCESAMPAVGVERRDRERSAEPFSLSTRPVDHQQR